MSRNQIVEEQDVVVIGGGAAGLMCAAVAGARGQRVAVLEGSRDCGRKILMSGGGRCNFTNMYSEPEHFLSANPHFCKSALARYTPWDFVAQVDAHGIAYHEKENGQLFCDGSAKPIVAMLLAECAATGVDIHTRVAIVAVERAAGGFLIASDAGVWRAASVVVATGGLSIPKMGASGFGFELARQHGLPVRSTRPALVPFTLDGSIGRALTGLAGIGVAVEASCNDAVFDAGALFTHRGLSGPAMLQVSSYWRAGDAVTVNFLPDETAEPWLVARREQRPAARLSNVLDERLPRRLAVCLCRDLGEHALGDPCMRALDDRQLGAIAQRLSGWTFTPAGTEGYRTAEVTGGGVATAALSSTTLEARDVPGLFFIGEVVDVTGHLGGHNFQWAWASAQAAGAVA